MGTTTFSGPIKSGTVREGSGQNTGNAVLSQTASLTHNGASARSTTITLPENAQIVDVIWDVTTALAGSTAMAATLGTAAAGTQFAASTDVQAGGRFRPTFTVAQLNLNQNIGTSTSLVATITPTGTATAGVVRVTVVYVQN
jgi:hypothetical protein